MDNVLEARHARALHIRARERASNAQRQKTDRIELLNMLNRDPTKSVYYDEIWNPYGVPPNGLPWKERDEDDSAEGTSSLYKVDEIEVQGGRPMRK